MAEARIRKTYSKIEKCNVLSMRLVIRKRNEEKSNSCQRSKTEQYMTYTHACLDWLSGSQLWKRGSELNGRLNRRNQISVLILNKREVESHLLVDSAFPDTI